MMSRLVLLVSAAAMVIMPVQPVVAQNSPDSPDISRRVDRIERELRAVQRRVFPGAQDGLFQPEVQPADTAAMPSGISGATPVAELTARVDAIEGQVARLTEQVEQSTFRQRELEAAIARLRTELSGRIDRIEAGPAAAPASEGAAGTPVAVTPAPATPAPAPRPAATSPAPVPVPSVTRPAPTPAPTAVRPTTTPTPAPTPSRPTNNAATAAAPSATTAERRARVAAIEVPSTGNAAEDAYIYGYRLWEADLFPEAQVQLQKVIDDHGTHRRASYAGNLLGRAFLDNNQPTQAVRAFYDNYRARPRGERAPDSVYYMGQALIQLNRRSDACQTFDEFTRVYGTTASADLRARVATARGTAGCGS